MFGSVANIKLYKNIWSSILQQLPETHWNPIKRLNSDFYRLIKSLCISDTTFNLARNHRIESLTVLYHQYLSSLSSLGILNLHTYDRDLLCGALAGGWYQLVYAYRLEIEKDVKGHGKYVYYAYQGMSPKCLELVQPYYEPNNAIKGATSGFHNAWVLQSLDEVDADDLFVEACLTSNIDLVYKIIPLLECPSLISVGFAYLCRHTDINTISDIFSKIFKFGPRISWALLEACINFNFPVINFLSAKLYLQSQSPVDIVTSLYDQHLFSESYILASLAHLSNITPFKPLLDRMSMLTIENIVKLNNGYLVEYMLEKRGEITRKDVEMAIRGKNWEMVDKFIKVYKKKGNLDDAL